MTNAIHFSPLAAGFDRATAATDAFRKRRDWKERADATEERLRGQFMAALAGNGVAYQQFLTSLSTHLRAFFRRRMTHLPDDVEDMVQETLLAIHNNRRACSGRSYVPRPLGAARAYT